VPIGPLELVIVLVIVLILFGGRRLPALGRQLGGGMREFKESVTGDKPAVDTPPEADATDAVHEARALPAGETEAEAAAPPSDTPSRSAEQAFGRDA
jgi:sec-independent protein translocase protein TatA